MIIKLNHHHRHVDNLCGSIYTSSAVAPLVWIHSSAIRVRERSATLEQAVAVLQQGIASSQQKVVLSNDAAFRAVRGSFRDLMKELLPSVSLILSLEKNRIYAYI